MGLEVTPNLPRCINGTRLPCLLAIHSSIMLSSCKSQSSAGCRSAQRAPALAASRHVRKLSGARLQPARVQPETHSSAPGNCLHVEWIFSVVACLAGSWCCILHVISHAALDPISDAGAEPQRPRTGQKVKADLSKIILTAARCGAPCQRSAVVLYMHLMACAIHVILH